MGDAIEGPRADSTCLLRSSATHRPSVGQWLQLYLREVWHLLGEGATERGLSFSTDHALATCLQRRGHRQLSSNKIVRSPELQPGATKAARDLPTVTVCQTPSQNR